MSGEYCGPNFRLFEAIVWNAVNQLESGFRLRTLSVVLTGIDYVPWILSTTILIGVEICFETVIRIS